MKLTLALLILLLAIILALFLPIRTSGLATQKESVAIESLLFSYEITSYPAAVEVTEPAPGNVLGISIDTDDIGFGAIPKGSSSKRYINISNENAFLVKIKLESAGSISSLVSFEEQAFLLGPGEIRTAPVTAKTEASTPAGNYTGEITITTVKPKNSFSSAIIGLV